MSREENDFNKLAKLLEQTLGDFDMCGVSDDDVNDVKVDLNKQTVLKNNADFNKMFSQFEQIQSEVDARLATTAASSSGPSSSSKPSSSGKKPKVNAQEIKRRNFLNNAVQSMVGTTVDRYDNLLADKNGTLTPEQRKSYEQQRDAMKLLLPAYGSLTGKDGQVDVNAIHQIMSTWQKLHDLGKPPEGLLNNLNDKPNDKPGDCNII